MGNKRYLWTLRTLRTLTWAASARFAMIRYYMRHSTVGRGPFKVLGIASYWPAFRSFCLSLVTLPQLSGPGNVQYASFPLPDTLRIFSLALDPVNCKSAGDLQWNTGLGMTIRITPAWGLQIFISTEKESGSKRACQRDTESCKELKMRKE